MISKLPLTKVRLRPIFKLTLVKLKIKSLNLLDDQGIAYSWIMVIATIVLFGFVLAFVAPMINPIIDVMNGMIGSGDVSQQTVDSFNFQKGLLIGVPAILLIGLFVFMVQRSLEVSSGGGDR